MASDLHAVQSADPSLELEPLIDKYYINCGVGVLGMIQQKIRLTVKEDEEVQEAKAE